MRDPERFIRDNTALISPPLVPEVKLHLAHEALALWEKTEEELQEIGLPPPYWAFAWAGGQALARYVLDNPETVAGKSVLDFAAGSGLVAIAALKAGAYWVGASDLDATARTAMVLNARANEVEFAIFADDLIGEDRAWQMVLIGDAFYEKPLADRLLPWLQWMAERDITIFAGDPSRSYFPRYAFERLATYEVPVTRALEDSEVKTTSVWRYAL